MHQAEPKYAPVSQSMHQAEPKYAPGRKMILTLLAAVTTIAGNDLDIISCFVSMLSQNMECPIGSSYLLFEATWLHTMFGCVPVFGAV
jgi:hypothetical protein